MSEKIIIAGETLQPLSDINSASHDSRYLYEVISQLTGEAYTEVNI